MTAEFEDPALAPAHGRKIGRPQFLRWGLITAAMGALSSNLNTILAGLGAPAVPVGLTQPAPTGDQDFLLYLMGNSAPACVFVGAGLALAATTELRRALKTAQEVASGQILAVWATWALLGLAFLGVISPAGTP
ncbi:MAG: hypothetical protein OEO83_05020 [Alphaproteobacteria bacterium]|nr:hypothetical protein [Alphaproteobacteria bacterium]